MAIWNGYNRSIKLNGHESKKNLSAVYQELVSRYCNDPPLHTPARGQMVPKCCAPGRGPEVEVVLMMVFTHHLEIEFSLGACTFFF